MNQKTIIINGVKTMVIVPNSVNPKEIPRRINTQPRIKIKGLITHHPLKIYLLMLQTEKMRIKGKNIKNKGVY